MVVKCNRRIETVISRVYIRNWRGCRFGVSWEKFVYYACKYTEQIQVRENIKDPHTIILNVPADC